MQKKAGHPLFEEVSEIVAGRCAMCHAAEPLWEGILTAPKNVYLESQEDILAQAEAIVMQSALSHAMPPANITYMETSERALIRRWYKDIFKARPSAIGRKHLFSPPSREMGAKLYARKDKAGWIGYQPSRIIYQIKTFRITQLPPLPILMPPMIIQGRWPIQTALLPAGRKKPLYFVIPGQGRI